ncbi:unnamed protein product [Blepharisma stoltei]|uniref:Uncharacterized protein n=1 Tax=Blepharisma stoltei TaxID=1481888 RepID=A0AAU9J0W5_9CILI|nr:unnamed protein product [Blepharisma stoltei]
MIQTNSKVLIKSSSCINLMLDNLPLAASVKSEISSKNFIARRKASPYCKASIKTSEKEKLLTKIRTGKVHSRFSAPPSQSSPVAKKPSQNKKTHKYISTKSSKGVISKKKSVSGVPESVKMQETARYYGRRESALTLPESLKLVEIESFLMTPIENKSIRRQIVEENDKSLLDIIEDIENFVS